MVVIVMMAMSLEPGWIHDTRSIIEQSIWLSRQIMICLSHCWAVHSSSNGIRPATALATTAVGASEEQVQRNAKILGPVVWYGREFHRSCCSCCATKVDRGSAGHKVWSTDTTASYWDRVAWNDLPSVMTLVKSSTKPVSIVRLAGQLITDFNQR